MCQKVLVEVQEDLEVQELNKFLKMGNSEKLKQEILNLLFELKFLHTKTQTSNQYYVNSVGSQVRIGEDNLITFLCNRGNVVKQDFEIKKDSFVEFSKVIY